MIGTQAISASEALEAFSSANPTAGAIVSFTGKVREDKSDKDVTQTLHLEAYEPLTSQKIEDKRQESLKRWDLEDATVLHRIGDIPVGETIVFVATAAKHRRDAFEAADFLMDYLKTEAFFWKKDIGTHHSQWIEPRSQDYEDAARWRASSDKFKATNQGPKT